MRFYSILPHFTTESLHCVAEELYIFQGVIAFKAYQYTPLTASTTLYYPWWAELVGWGCVLFPLVFIPAWFYYYTCHGGLWEV
jgi:hypothetical protein